VGAARLPAELAATVRLRQVAVLTDHRLVFLEIRAHTAGRALRGTGRNRQLATADHEHAVQFLFKSL
jgi:hypothetical protein